MKFTPLRLERLLARGLKISEQLLGTSGQIYVWHRVDEYRKMWQAASESYGAGFKMVKEDLWEIEKNGKKTRILNDKLQMDDPVTLILAGMKPVVYRLLAGHHLRVPDFRCFQVEEWPRVVPFLKRYRNGCVVKPANGTSSGQGVTTQIMTQRELKKAAILASLYGRELLIEPMFPGECYRLLVLHGEVIHAVCRRGLRLTGDGAASIAALFAKQAGTSETQSRRMLESDLDCRLSLSYQGLTMDSVPAEGKKVLLRSIATPQNRKAEVRTVYNMDATGIVCRAIMDDAVKAADIIGSEFLGVDFITTDPTVPLSESGGIINEVNTTPGLHHHYDSTKEAYPGVALQILDYLIG